MSVGRPETLEEDRDPGHMPRRHWNGVLSPARARRVSSVSDVSLGPDSRWCLHQSEPGTTRPGCGPSTAPDGVLLGAGSGAQTLWGFSLGQRLRGVLSGPPGFGPRGLVDPG